MTQVTEYHSMVQIISTNKTAGTQLAMLAASFPNDPNAESGTFDTALQLSPQAWAIEVNAKQAFVDVIDALMSGASIDDPRLAYIVSRGLTASLWGQAKQIIKATHYRIWQPDGTYTPNPDALAQWIAANGYEVVQ